MTTLYPNSLCRKLAPTMFVPLGYKSPWKRFFLLWGRTRLFLLRIFSRSNVLLAFGVPGDAMYTLCHTSLDISVRDSRLRHSCGGTTSAQTSCTSQAFLTVNTKTTSSCVTERVYCAYLSTSSQNVIVTLVVSPYVHGRVLRGATSPHSGSKAFLRVQNMMVGNFRSC